MKKLIPDVKRKPSTQVGLAAIRGNVPAVVIQDEAGGQVYITPKMARALGFQLSQMADLADGGMLTDPSSQTPEESKPFIPFIRQSSGLVM